MQVVFSKKATLSVGQTISSSIQLDGQLVGIVLPAGITGTVLKVQVLHPDGATWLEIHEDDIDAGGMIGAYNYVTTTLPVISTLRGAGMNAIDGESVPIPFNATIRFVASVAQATSPVDIYTIVRQ